MKKSNTLLPLIIIAISIGAVVVVTKMKPRPAVEQKEKVIPTVTVVHATKQDYEVHLSSTGTVQSETAVTLVPEVSGKIVFVSSKMVRGGTFKKGDLLFRIDQREYTLQVESAEAAVERQQVKYQTEQAQADIARKEWEQFHKEHPDSTAGELTLREPQLKMEEVNLKAAQAQLELAKLRLQKTEIRAPFSGRVIERKVSIGQYVAPGTQMASIVSREKIEIAVPFSIEEAALIPVEQKPEALIYPPMNRKPIKARATRAAAQLDQRSRMLDIIVEVSPRIHTSVQLLDGMFLPVEITGKKLNAVFVIPREVLHGDTLWLVDNGKLQTVRPHVLAREKTTVVIDGTKLPADISIVSSMLDIAIDGIELKVAE